jgi:hypothetical protein
MAKKIFTNKFKTTVVLEGRALILSATFYIYDRMLNEKNIQTHQSE